MKTSEARIITYLSQVHNTRKYLQAIANKLGMDYSYCMRVVQEMHSKQWLKKHKYGRRVFYDLTPNTPVNEAKITYLSEATKFKQLNLKELNEPEQTNMEEQNSMTTTNSTMEEQK